MSAVCPKRPIVSRASGAVAGRPLRQSAVRNPSQFVYTPLPLAPALRSGAFFLLFRVVVLFFGVGPSYWASAACGPAGEARPRCRGNRSHAPRCVTPGMRCLGWGNSGGRVGWWPGTPSADRDGQMPALRSRLSSHQPLNAGTSEPVTPQWTGVCGQSTYGGPPPLLASTDRADDALVACHRRCTSACLGAGVRGRGFDCTFTKVLRTVAPKANLARLGGCAATVSVECMRACACAGGWQAFGASWQSVARN